MTNVLSDFRALGHYDSATQTIIIDSDLNQFKTATESATISITNSSGGSLTDPQGVDFEIKIVYKDADTNTSNLIEFERGSFSYSIDGSLVVSFQRQSTFSSTTGGAITFDAWDGVNPNLVIFGTAGDNQFVDNRKLTGVSAFLVSSQAITAGTETTLTNFTESWDVGNDFSAGAYRVPFTGKYRISGCISYNVASDQDAIRAIIAVDGTNLHSTLDVASSGSSKSIGFNKLVSLTAGQVVTIKALNSDSADTVRAGNDDTFFDIEYLGY